ncbi:benzoate 4-monooxygenase cytochrome P450 [Cucurbitaria berberidis CBS 394.84]|uniref:Benzoate 4-monooxygenase cytochrome P450 n=1 Tax=Cucurbitaria berberidis CBS 394.84 TaxID=1168544 RepID=A0A9P4LAN2_9PLEO|nr:benzoate 4-monooxygenase cytochrome P450 [Cucurbitaria berberidis CBS 394.84]KAF1847369.1 benzoate 4-monooxygenase cytochrome P450 [Cucurbitaria berberidis CBS 394.84]
MSRLITATFFVGLLALKVIISWVYTIIYNLYFHPLSRFPGPKHAAASHIAYSWWFLGGSQPYKVLDLHRKYGPVVRVAPNELSFNSAQSWKDIYGFRQGHKPFVKSEFYDGGSFAARGVHSIVSERDPAVHGQMRRLLAHAFSNTSLLEQEELVAKTVDRLVQVVWEQGANSGASINIGKAYEMMAFDIIGDLAFGETFQALGNKNPHPWIEITLGALTQGALADTMKRFPGMAKVVKWVLSSKIAELTDGTKRNEDMAIDLLNRRISRRTRRRDFMTRILEHRDLEKKQTSDLELAAHASDFVLAGSETTSTVLACMTFYLLKNPHIMAQLQNEIRSTFDEYSAISDISTRPLRYLNAVCLEAMRMYAPLPFSLPRLVPEGGGSVDGHLLPEGMVVSTSPVGASLDPANFSEPFTFKPKRWLTESPKDVLEASQPFSLGARGCLGKSLGWMEMRTTLAKILWTFDMEFADPVPDWHGDSRMYTLWSKPQLHVRVKPVRTPPFVSKAR